MIYQNLVVFEPQKLITPTEYFDFKNPPMDPYELSNTLMKALGEIPAIGIAANQLGIPYSVFAMYGEPNYVCFNPRIVFYSENLVELEEGCVSFPDVFGLIKRPATIRMRFQTPSGTVVTQKLEGLTARVAQHEYDHLQGKLFYNLIERPQRDLILRKAQKKFNERKTNGK